jgi:thioredoxin-like negative regulator of GroEL
VTPTTGADEVLAVLAGLGVRPGEAELTAVQFSTAFCGPCRATRARLQHLQRTRPGFRAVQVDAESHLDAVRALHVRGTPTVIWVDGRGAPVARSAGAPSVAELAALVDAHTSAPQ